MVDLSFKSKHYMQGFYGCDEAISSMHSGEVRGDELINLDEEVANTIT